MEFDYTLNPVDRTAKVVISQAGCSETVYISSPDEILPILANLEKRRKYLKKQLGIERKSQVKNRKKYIRKPVRITAKGKLHIQRYNDNRELFQELLFNGQQICKFRAIRREMKNNQALKKTDAFKLIVSLLGEQHG